MLLDKWDGKIRNILQNDNYNCMEIDSEEAFNKLVEIFPCELKNTMNQGKSKYSVMNLEYDEKSSSVTKDGKFLKRMPYSACVPKLFVEIKEFVNNCAKFAEGLNSSQTELDDMVRKPTNHLITLKLNGNIKSLIKTVSLAQV
jgi:hypothetical protein